jgi:hypothetical protein
VDGGNGDLRVLLDAAGDWLREACGRRPEFRALLRTAASWLADLSREERPVAPAPPEEQVEQLETPRVTPAVPVPPPPRGPAVLHIGPTPVVVDVAGTREERDRANRAARTVGEPVTAGTPTADPQIDLAVIARRCTLKAECCRWAITRRRRIAEDAPWDTAIRPADEELKARLKALPNCFAWTLDPYADLPGDRVLEDMAAGYENLSTAATLVSELVSGEETDEGFREETYELLAEAQSALRKSLEDALVLRRDPDQHEAFLWLRHRTHGDGVFIRRHMRLNDPADPANYADLQHRLEELNDRIEGHRSARRGRKKLLMRLRNSARRIADNPTDATPGDWEDTAESIEALVGQGCLPSDRDLRELLLPIVELIPGSLEPGPGFSACLDAIDRYLAHQESSREVVLEEPAVGDDFRRVVDLLRGRVVVMIGGQRRVHAQRALERSLELAELRWIATAPHEPLSTFEPQIARAEVALVMLAIRWASHSFEGVKAICERHGKPFVRLPAGYSPNRVAAEILDQASERLATLRPEPEPSSNRY